MRDGTAPASGEWRPNYGSSHPFSKLDEDKVREIRRLSREGTSYVALARRFEVDRQTIKKVVRRESWRHVD